MDLDDTLIPNHHLYSKAQLDFAYWVINTTGHRGPDAQSIINIQVEIDSEAAEKFGFGMERFPGSFQEAFKKICEGIGRDVSEEELNQAYMLGMRAFDESSYVRNGFLPGARETLDFLKERGEGLALLTKGDSRVQNKKIEALELQNWFGENMYVVDRKHPHTITEILNGHNPERVWKVGNSIRSDVLPALEAGIGALYVPCETWAFERKHDGLPDHPRVARIESLEKFPDFYERL